MNYEIAIPKPNSLIESLRSVGYSLPTAIADIVDNSIAAESRNVWICFHWAGTDSHISVVDDGHGMTETELHEAMRPGSRSPLEERDANDLGRFGLGLKTASFSQCRKLEVCSQRKGHRIAERAWDIDYVISHNEWRLLKSANEARNYAEQLKRQHSGTLVFWTHLDRLTRGENTGDAAAHRRFNDAIDSVRQHLALTFHRFIESGSIKLHLNGHAVVAWNPFMEGHGATYRTPEEAIPYGESEVRFRGFVLPHKDMLTPEEFSAAGGVAGWTGHQGFYVYRNRRLLVPGDWLRLGRPNAWTKAEQFNLARIRLDLPNDVDSDWQLDVKKSAARPPALIRERLTELAENIRVRARAVFVHRGRYGPRIPAVEEFQRPWSVSDRNGKRVCKINRIHPAVSLALSAAGKSKPEIEALLRVLEETVPVQQIWLDVAEQVMDGAKPYEEVESSVLRSDLRRILNFMTESGINKETAKANLQNIEPFNHYPRLIREL